MNHRSMRIDHCGYYHMNNLNKPDDDETTFVQGDSSDLAPANDDSSDELSDEPTRFISNQNNDDPKDSFDYDPELDKTTEEQVPKVEIGPYKLIEKLGEGGMGTVYLAEQEHPVRRQVALKIIKIGMQTDQVISRFEMERQALAMMDHDHIAKVLDAGSTEDGRPFFVMELVDGIPITHYCDQKRLNISERLHLFIQVCNAVQHAHQKGIIHRDLKPTNILVTTRDDHPIPKVIDFGLAKATKQSLTEETFVTTYGQIMGTLEYMSPEQANMDEMDIDTRSDIYSLGVILYELLTGSTPLNGKTIRKQGYVEALRRIQEEEIEKPSTRLISAKESIQELSDARQIDPAKFTKIMKGELDWIVLKAAQKDRSQRYESTGELANDIERYLNLEPIEARPPSFGYKLKKSIRKNMLAYSFAFTVLFLLVAGVFICSYLALWALNEADNAKTAYLSAESDRKSAVESKELAETRESQAKEAKAIAEASEKRSKTVLEIVTNSFANTGPGQTTNFDMLASEALERAYRRVNEQVKNDPLTKAELLFSLGRAFLGLGKFNLCAECAEEALEIYTNELGERDLQSLRSMRMLSYVEYMRGRFQEAIQIAETALELHLDVLGPENMHTVSCSNTLALSLAKTGKLVESTELLETNYTIGVKLLGEEDINNLNILSNIADNYRNLGKLDQAIEHATKSFETKKKLFGADEPDTLRTMCNLGNMYRQNHQLKESFQTLTECVDRLTVKLGNEHPETMIAEGNLARTYMEIGQANEAAKRFERILAIQRRILGNDSLRTINTIRELGLTYFNMRENQKAAALFRESMLYWEKENGKNSTNALINRTDLAINLFHLGQLEEARTLYEQSIEPLKQLFGDENEITFSCYKVLSHIYYKQKEYEKAIKALELCIPLETKAFGADHREPLLSQFYLATNYQMLGNDPKAIEILETLTPKMLKVLGLEIYDTVVACHKLANLYTKAETNEKAFPYFLESIKGYEKHRGLHNKFTVNCMKQYGDALLNCKRIEEAINVYHECMERIKDSNEQMHTLPYLVNLQLAEAYFTNKQLDKARELLEETLEPLQKRLGKTNFNVIRCMELMATIDGQNNRRDRAIEILKEAIDQNRDESKRESLETLLKSFQTDK